MNYTQMRRLAGATPALIGIYALVSGLAGPF